MQQNACYVYYGYQISRVISLHFPRPEVYPDDLVPSLGLEKIYQLLQRALDPDAILELSRWMRQLCKKYQHGVMTLQVGHRRAQRFYLMHCAQTFIIA